MLFLKDGERKNDLELTSTVPFPAACMYKGGWVCGKGSQRGEVAMTMRCLYLSCRMVTSSLEDGGFEASNWPKSSLRTAVQRKTHDPKGCCDLILRPNVLLEVVGEAHNLSVQSNVCEAAPYQTRRITTQ